MPVFAEKGNITLQIVVFLVYCKEDKKKDGGTAVDILGQNNVKMENEVKKNFPKKLGDFILKIVLVLAETVILLAIALYGMMFVLAKGPSPTARDIFVMSVRETSAVGFLANLFFTEDEIAQIEAAEEVAVYVETDTSLINIQKPQAQPDQSGNNGPAADEWGFVDEDGDGIIIDEVHGEGYSGYMMIVLDPSRVIVGTVPEAYGGRGYTVAELVERFGAVAGINAGGFVDNDGRGDGSIPDSLVVYEGKSYEDYRGTREGFVGIDDNYILHVGNLTHEDIMARNIRYGASFGPVLIVNGEPAANLTSGVNPRTAIGQRSDGAILMLVIDGRQVISLGATLQDLVDVFQEYGAVNACNLDGGSSSLMWYGGDYINNCASVIGIRPVPTTFLVMKEGGARNE